VSGRFEEAATRNLQSTFNVVLLDVKRLLAKVRARKTGRALQVAVSPPEQPQTR